MRLKGFTDSTEIFVAPRATRRAVTESPEPRSSTRVRESGLLARRPSRRRAAVRRARLDLPARPRGRGSPVASAVTALHVNYGLRDGADADERHCARAVRAARGGARGAAAEPARSAGTSRPGRATSATATAARSRSQRGADVGGRATPPPTRSRRSSTGSRRRPAAGRCSACARATGCWCGRCSSSRASRRRRTARRAG